MNENGKQFYVWFTLVTKYTVRAQRKVIFLRGSLPTDLKKKNDAYLRIINFFFNCDIFFNVCVKIILFTKKKNTFGWIYYLPTSTNNEVNMTQLLNVKSFIFF